MLNAIRESLRHLSRRQKVSYFTLVILRSLSSLLDVLGLALIGLLTGLAATSIDPNQPLVILGYELPRASEESLIIITFSILGVFTLKALLAIFLSKVITVLLALIESEKAQEIAAFLFSGNLTSLHRFNKGEIVWATTGSVSIAYSGLLTSLSIFISEGTLLALILITFFVIDPIAAIFVIIYFGIIIAILQLAIAKALKRAGAGIVQGNVQSMGVLEDTVNAFREITVLNKQQFFIEKFAGFRLILARSVGATNFLNGMPRYVVETALMLGVVIFVGYQFLTGQLATGLVTVGIFLTGGVRVMASLLPLQNVISGAKIQIEQSRLAHQILAEIQVPQSAEKSKISGGMHANLPQPRSGLSIEIEQVSYTYPDAVAPAISNISMEVQSGKHVAIIGPSGAGKTTLVDLLLGLIEPTQGSVKVGNVKSEHHSLIQRGFISYVPQRPGLINGTIAENVALGIPTDQIDEERVMQSLKSANLSDFIAELPDGIQSTLGNQANALSGGQIQRLGLARALYNKPHLIVLDEATSALDAKSESIISDTLRNLDSNVTIIVIAHRLSTVQNSDEVFVVEDGKISASGSFSHLRKTVPMVAEYVKLMSFEDLSD